MSNNAQLRSVALEEVKNRLADDFCQFCDEFQAHTAKFVRRLCKEFEMRAEEFLTNQKRRFGSELEHLLLELEQENVRFRQDVEDEKRALDEEKSVMAGIQKFQQNKVKLDVGGFYYSTSIDTLRRDPHSLLASMFSGRYKLQSEDGRFFVDRNGEYFSYILDFLRDGSIILPSNADIRDQILKEAEYYRIRLHPPVVSGEEPDYYKFSWEGHSLLPMDDYGRVRSGHDDYYGPIAHVAPAPSPKQQARTSALISQPHGGVPVGKDVWDPKKTSSHNTISPDQLTATAMSTQTSSTSLCTNGHAAGRHKWEIKVNKLTSDIGIGVAVVSIPLNRMLGTTGIGEEGGLCYHSSGNTFNNGNHTEFGEEFGTGDIITVWLDLQRRELTFGRNGVDLGVAFDGSQLPDPTVQPLHLAVSLYGRDSSVTIIGQEHFSQ